MAGAVRLHSCQTLTPETETTTHYFFQQAYHAPAPMPATTETIFQGLLTAFEEDRAIITAHGVDPKAPIRDDRRPGS